MTDDQAGQAPAIAYHPEEIRAAWEVRVGKSVTLQASARCTPAGVVTAGIAASAVLIAVAVLVRELRRRP